MRSVFIAMLLIGVISTIAKAQQWQSFASVESRVGYSTNSYLNPFWADWDSSAESAYNFTSAILQSYWNQQSHSLSLTGGFVYEPIFDLQQNWKGILAVADYHYRFSNDWSAGLEAGASYFSASYRRKIAWIQPKITWFASPFTLFRLKSGFNFKDYNNYEQTDTGPQRYDLFGIEMETWPTYNWQFSAGLYGSMAALPDITESFNSNAGISYNFKSGASAGLNLRFQQYQSSITEEIQNGGNGGGPPVGGPSNPNQSTTTVTTYYTDSIFQTGAEGSYPLNQNFSVFAAADMLFLNSETSGSRQTDFELSGGIRYSFEPRIFRGKGAIEPNWRIRQNMQEVVIPYAGEGRLYLVGEFNNWNKAGIPLREQSENKYVAKLKLNSGAYEYKVLRMKGDTQEWLPFSNEIYTVDDGFGGENAMLLVQ